SHLLHLGQRRRLTRYGEHASLRVLRARADRARFFAFFTSISRPTAAVACLRDSCRGVGQRPRAECAGLVCLELYPRELGGLTKMKSTVPIIGAGPAGLTAAYLLSKNKVDVSVLEADPIYVGGISPGWAAPRIRGLSLGSAIKNALLPQRSSNGDRTKVIKTLINSFRYPRKGPGMMWEAAAAKVKTMGGKVEMGSRVNGCSYDE